MGLRIILGDITLQHTDAIVNAANTSLLGGGGVDGAIHRAAGPALLAECRQLKGCETGQAKITGGYRLPAKYVIHTPGPIWQGGRNNEPSLLSSCYTSSLTLAAQYGCTSVAFPSISTGVYRFPLDRAAAIAVQSITRFLSSHSSIDIVLVCFDQTTYTAYCHAFAENNKKNTDC